MTDFERVPAIGGMTFSDAVVVPAEPGRWIYIAGQIAVDPEIGPAEVTSDVATQSHAIFDQIENRLADFEADLSNVVQISVHMTSFDEYSVFGQVRAERFGDTLPVSTAVQVAGLLLGATVEVGAVAFVPSA